ncbi:hypothetical protein [Rubrivivax sp. A210]|uniref:hypothetical protein n=1 Tax=Rubrivivax sp. A210 TaxID=2772301 RepID=UPI003988941C
MDTSSSSASARAAYELRFRSLFNARRGYSFPCDPCGQVNLDQLSESARNNYFYARAAVGRDLATPAVEPLNG